MPLFLYNSQVLPLVLLSISLSKAVAGEVVQIFKYFPVVFEPHGRVIVSSLSGSGHESSPEAAQEQEKETHTEELKFWTRLLAYKLMPQVWEIVPERQSLSVYSQIDTRYGAYKFNMPHNNKHYI